VSKFDEFVAHFEPLYGKLDPRWQCIKHMSKSLFDADSPIHIVETGSMRKINDWNNDGNMTMVWDWIARETGGTATSIDLDPEASACVQANCPNTTTVTGDSVTALRSLVFPNPIDVLFLDSYDYSVGHEVDAAMHQLAELASIWEKLPNGCLIASDDCVADNQGKHVFTKKILDGIGCTPWIKGYISVWTKRAL